MDAPTTPALRVISYLKRVLTLVLYLYWKQEEAMGLIAVVLGGVLGAVAAIVGLVGFDVSWGMAFALYFCTAIGVSVPLILAALRPATDADLEVQISQWEEELKTNMPLPPEKARTRLEQRAQSGVRKKGRAA